MKNDISLVSDLMQEGNFKQAISVCRKLLKTTPGLREKAKLNRKISASDQYYNNIITISPGEAFFPVVKLNTQRGIVLKVKVGIGANVHLTQGLMNSWEKIKKITTSFLDEFLYSKVKTLSVLDWGINKYELSIADIPGSELDIKELIDGRSIELAMFISLLSAVLKENVTNNFVFTGSVNDDFTVGHSENLEIKAEAIRMERPMVTHFIVPSVKNAKQKILKPVSSLKDAVNIIFPGFSELIEKRKNDLGERRLTLHKRIVKDLDDNIVEYADFNLGGRENILENEGELVYRFLSNNIQLFKGCPRGLIISGLTINYSAPMFVLPLLNHTPAFLALRYNQTKNLKDNQGAAYIILSREQHHKPGEMIIYKLPKSFS